VAPANCPPHDLRELLAKCATVCLLKASTGLPQEATLPECEAVYVEELGTEREWLTHDLAAAAQRQAYFALALLRPKREATTEGKLWVVGLGPGDPRLLTGEAREALRAAEVIVGYEGYLQLLAPLGLRAEMRGSPIGAEAERATLALELAAGGRRVALVSSGDAGVFGMAGLLLEMTERYPDLDVEVVPGV